MKFERTNIGFRFWFLWVLVTSLGWKAGLGAAFFVGTVVTEMIVPEGGLEREGSGLVGLAAAFLVAVLVIAILVSVGQWLILREHIPRAGWWVLVSIISMIIGMGVALDISKDVLSWTAFGAIVGLAQWLVLRRHAIQAGWWILIRILCGAAGGFAGMVTVEIAFMRKVVSTMDITLAAIVIPPVVMSMITGAALVWLLRLDDLLEDSNHWFLIMLGRQVFGA